MNNELGALKKIGNLHSITKGCAISYTDEYKVIEQSLLELKAIKEAKPSEAMDYLVDISIFSKDYDEFGNYKFQKEYEHIKATLLKAENLEKAIKIIAFKKVDIQRLLFMNTCEDYNAWVGITLDRELTEEEFNLLKEMIE